MELKGFGVFFAHIRVREGRGHSAGCALEPPGGVKLGGKYKGSSQHFPCPQRYFKMLSFYSLIEHLLCTWGFTYVAESLLNPT